MDRIKLACPSCGLNVAAARSYAGKRMRCPGCGAAVVVPGHVPAPDAVNDPGGADAGRDVPRADAGAPAKPAGPVAPNYRQMWDERLAESADPGRGVANREGAATGWKWKAVGVIVLYLHILGATVSFSFFSYDYAREHGFTSWLFLGEFVPAGKAAIWEYYAYRSLTGWKGSARESAESKHHFMRSGELFAEAHALVDRGGAEATDADRAKYLRLLREALAEAEQVEDEALDRVHPGIRWEYRERFQKGLEMMIEGVSGDGRWEQVAEGFFLVKSWGEWMGAHAEQLRSW